jgi:hypothetical protein
MDCDREPTAWFDKACLIQNEAAPSPWQWPPSSMFLWCLGFSSCRRLPGPLQESIDLGCLPVYIMSCQSMLVLSGNTFTKRLW